MSQTPSRTVFDLAAPTAVMTFNIKNGWDMDSWNGRKDLLVDVVRQANPLLMGTQEGFGPQLDYIRDNLPGYDYVGLSRYPDGADEFNAIFFDTTRVTVREAGTVWLSDTPDIPGSRFEDEDLPRIASWALCQVSGHDRDLLMVNTHLTYRDHGIDAQVRVLLEQLAIFAPLHIDTILTGDFNTQRHSRTWNAFRQIGFADAWEFATAEIGPNTTFHDWKGASPVEGDENRIDWILYRPGEGHSLPQHCIIETIDSHDGETYPSDHFPVVLRTT